MVLVITLPWTRQNHPKPADLAIRDRVLGWAASYVDDPEWFIQKAIAKGATVMAIPLPGFQGLLEARGERESGGGGLREVGSAEVEALEPADVQALDENQRRVPGAPRRKVG